MGHEQSKVPGASATNHFVTAKIDERVCEWVAWPFIDVKGAIHQFRETSDHLHMSRAA